MAKYRFVAVNAEGEEVSGSVHAESEAEVEARLAGRGMTASMITLAQEANPPTPAGHPGPGLSPVPPAPAAAPPPLAPPVAAGTSGLAIASLVCSLMCISLVGVILGHLAMGEIRRSGNQLAGSGMATWGLWLGYLGLIGGLIYAIVVFGAIIMAASV
ncbi:MAG: DUF4190 domain-containing protein [Verrucomicrobiota bacterium]